MADSTWDPIAKAASVTLSNANRTANVPQTWGGVRATQSRLSTASIRRYGEFTFAAAGGDGYTSIFFGICNALWAMADGASNAHALGMDANGWAVGTNPISYLATPHNGLNSGYTTAGLPIQGFGDDTIGQTIGMDVGGGEVTFYGTGAYVGAVCLIHSGVTGYVYPACSASQHDARNQQVTWNGGSSAWKLPAIPAGRIPWNTDSRSSLSSLLARL